MIHVAIYESPLLPLDNGHHFRRNLYLLVRVFVRGCLLPVVVSDDLRHPAVFAANPISVVSVAAEVAIGIV